jgi:hypothetical protein
MSRLETVSRPTEWCLGLGLSLGLGLAEWCLGFGLGLGLDTKMSWHFYTDLRIFNIWFIDWLVS